MSPRAHATATTPFTADPLCPKCRTPLRITLKTSWGAYYACAPCDWQIYSTEPTALPGASSSKTDAAA